MSDPNHPEISVQVVEAKGVFGRMIGLLGSDGVGPGRGMLLRTRQVHTVGMRFAIDAVYIKANGQVLRVKSLKPNRFGPMLLSAKWVLEMQEGEAARVGITEDAILLAADGE